MKAKNALVFSKHNLEKKNKKTSATLPSAKVKKAALTSAQGIPISDDQNSLHYCPTGPTLLEDFFLREKIFHFDHERIPERVVHARGYAAHGFLEVYRPIPEFTKADVFQRQGNTPVFVRFSTVAGSKGSSDLARDVRGFAVKIYTNQGNWDIVGNNIPVFFIQDAIKFPDLIHAAKEEPDTGFPQAQTAHNNFWDFIGLNPESLHTTLWAMSDRGIPRSFRFMEGFGVHTFRLINAKNESNFVKFHWKPKLGLQSVTWDEALRLNGADPDFHRRDLWDAIQSGHYPEWEFGLQIFSEEMAKSFDFDILDATKFIPEELIPVLKVGRLVLNRCVENFFSETEQVAFCTANIVPGIDFTDDPLLQGRNFSYLDTQLSRLGSPNFTKLPINSPKCPIHHFQQDGSMAFSNLKGSVNYEPNSLDDKKKILESQREGFKTFPTQPKGKKHRFRPESFSDYYSQPSLFYNSQTEIEQKHIQNAFSFELSKVTQISIQTKIISHLLCINQNLGNIVANKLGFTTLPKPAIIFRSKKPKIKSSPALSIIKNSPKKFRGRKIGILITKNSDFSLIGSLHKLISKKGIDLEAITPKIHELNAKKYIQFKSRQCLTGTIAACYDAIALMITSKDLASLDKATLINFIQDSYYNYKFIAYSDSLTPIFRALNINKDGGLLKITSPKDWKLFIKLCTKIRYWQRTTANSAT